MEPMPPADALASCPDDLFLQLDTEATALSEARRRLTSWAEQTSLDAERQASVAMAVYEAMVNAARHAYPANSEGPIWVIARCQAQQGVTVTVSDDGRWRTPDGKAGTQGHGLRVIHAVSAADVHRTPEGTTVTMNWPFDCRRILCVLRAAWSDSG